MSSPNRSGTKLWRITDQGWVMKKRSEHLNIPQSTIIQKWKEYFTTTNLPRAGRPKKLTDQARRALIREATKRPKITLKELQNSTAEIGVSVHRTTLRVARKKQFLQEKNKQTRLVFAKRHVGDSPNRSGTKLWRSTDQGWAIKKYPKL